MKIYITLLAAFSLIGQNFFQLDQLGDLWDKAKSNQVRSLLDNPSITTSFSDASLGSSLPDTFGNDLKPKNLVAAPRSPNGGYLLAPGFYETTLRSYCIKAGTHAPGKGDGYLYAPLKGRRAEIVRTIVRETERHAEISQQDVQWLLWAVIARAKYSNLAPKIRSVAETLLSKKQVSDLNGGILGIVPDAVMKKAIASLPREAQKVAEIENRMRALFERPTASFGEFERLAVLAGAAVIDRPDIKRGRWSKHPDGYFVRYFPSGYSQTRVQVYVPDASGSSTRRAGRSSFLPTTAQRNTVEFDATDDVAVPANTGAQRLAQSNVPVNGGATPIASNKQSGERRTAPTERRSAREEECQGGRRQGGVEYPVRHIEQPDAASCWSAAAGMVLGRRSGVPQGEARLYPGGGLVDTDENIAAFARSHGLRMQIVNNLTPDEILRILREARGPLWAGGRVRGNNTAEGSRTSFPHVVVISGLEINCQTGYQEIVAHDPEFPASNRSDGYYRIEAGYWLQENQIRWILYR
ncbi:MAG: hypothetical protein M3X11_05505 [Acidobacteriota bacterium]|nr:hypothetical protein [Acidobacteriota bacterium]